MRQNIRMAPLEDKIWDLRLKMALTREEKVSKCTSEELWGD